MEILNLALDNENLISVETFNNSLHKIFLENFLNKFLSYIFIEENLNEQHLVIQSLFTILENMNKSQK